MTWLQVEGEDLLVVQRTGSDAGRLIGLIMQAICLLCSATACGIAWANWSYPYLSLAAICTVSMLIVCFCATPERASERVVARVWAPDITAADISACNGSLAGLGFAQQYEHAILLAQQYARQP